MNEALILKLIIAAIFGGGSSLVGKIVFDWLKERRNGDSAPVKPVVPNLYELFDPSKCDQRHREIGEWIRSADQSFVSFSKDIQGHKERLDNGKKDLDEIKKSIAGLDKSYAVLAEKIGKQKG